VVLPETPIDGATKFAERIRYIIEETAFDYDGEMLRVTVSAGVAALAPDDTMQSLVERADGLLYRAKEEGRNGVCGG